MTRPPIRIGAAGWNVPSLYCGALLDRFLSEVTGLGDKLGVLLVQLPPKSVFKKPAADSFFRDLRARIDTDVVLEPRHASWFAQDIDDWLIERNTATGAALGNALELARSLSS